MSKPHPLRDLAAKLREECRIHPAYSQAIDIVNNCADHLEAVGFSHEANATIEEQQRNVTWLETNADPAGTLASNYRLTNENMQLRFECNRLAFHKNLSPETWALMSLDLRRRWWVETNYGQTPPSADMLKEINALAPEPR